MRKTVQKILHNQLQKSAFSRAKYTLLGVIWRETQLCFVQFFDWRYPVRTLIHTLAVLFSAWIRLFLGRSVKYSFSHYAEDKIIEGILKPLITVNGFYVEVGCNHPIFLSNTYGLYRKGWRGICIDANLTLIQKYKVLRPKDLAICSLISFEEREMDFYVGENDVLSTTETRNLRHEDAKDIEFEKLTLTARKLTTILDEINAPKIFDLLAIDAEEHDFEVLKSLDFEKYHPDMVMIEDETFDMAKPHDNAIFQWMTARGYRCEGFISKNIYFVSVSI